MKNRVNLQALKINGHDPRYSQPFQSLSVALGQLNKKTLSHADWETLEQLCYQQFHSYGYDLQTGAWFCLINSKLYGWRGLLQALELLNSAWGSSGTRCWPPNSAAPLRQSILGWLTQHVVTLMYTLPMTAQEQTTIQRVENEVRLLCGYASSLEASCEESLETVRYFLQVRTHSLGVVVARKQSPLAECRADKVTRQQCATYDEITVSPVTTDMRNTPSNTIRTGILSGVAGVFLGIALTLAIKWGEETFIASDWSYAIAAPISQLQSSAQSILETDPDLSRQKVRLQKDTVVPLMREQLLWLATMPPQLWIMQGQILAQQLEQVYPGNMASAAWQKKMLEKSGILSSGNYWHHGMVGLSQLEQRLEQSEKNHRSYMTVSELKTAVYQIKQSFQQQGEPLAEQLNGLQADINLKKNISPATVHQIQTYIDAILAKYMLLKQDLLLRNTG